MIGDTNEEPWSDGVSWIILGRVLRETLLNHHVKGNIGHRQV